MAKEELKKSKGVEPKKEEEEEVSIKKDDLSELMDRIKRLEFAASKARTSQYDEQMKKDVGKQVKLRTYGGKIVTHWDDLLTNRVEKNVHGGWEEDQTIKVYFEDDTNKILPLGEFVRGYKYIKSTVISTTVENAGSKDEKTIFKVVTDDEKEFLIDIKFVN